MLEVALIVLLAHPSSTFNSVALEATALSESSGAST